MERSDTSDLVRTALDTIRDIKETGVSPTVSAKLDNLARSLSAAHADTRHNSAKPRRPFGAFAGRFTVGPTFFEPMADDDKRAWGED